MADGKVNLFTVLKNFIKNRGNILTTQNNRTKPKTTSIWEEEFKKEEAIKKENEALLAKRERVYSKWNDFKSVFGFGEKLTREEAEKLVAIDAQKHFRDTLEDKSVFDVGQ